jgi:uncharacterized repeat protein (TIGR04138 family)
MTQQTRQIMKTLEQIAERNRRYRLDAYSFVLAALNVTVSQLPTPRHITGRELLDGIRAYGLQEFGPLTRSVFEHWGVTTTEDFGHIVFHLVEAGLLGKTEHDRLEDFRNVYDFSDAFERGYRYVE